jgi:hypothetical protein
MSMARNYGEPVCQTLKATPLDDLIVRLVLAALEPAALEASLLATNELERERAALDAQWRHRLERAGYQAERARRQFDATEPENRLVARSLEGQWERALAEQAHLAADYEDFRRNQPRALTPASGRHPRNGSRPAWHLASRNSGGAPDTRTPAARAGAGRSR